MVKNTQGGSSHKKFARKHTSESRNNNKLRISLDKGEIYAIVTKMLGNGMFHCYCIDNIVRLGHIRGKFSGRGKRDNMVESGKWVLIGLREWDIPSDKNNTISKGQQKMQQCDLLEVYSDMDKLRLKDSCSERWTILENNDVNKTLLGESGNLDDEFVFSTDKDIERERLIEEMKSSKTEKIKFDESNSTKINTEDEINFDDI